MNRRPGHVDVTTEVGYCNFCNRTRNLRREEHHLGTFVRTIVTCESCHRTLSSSMGVAKAEPEMEPEPASAPAPEPAAAASEKPAKPRRTPAKPATAAKKSTARGGKPTSTARRKATRSK